MAALKDKRPVPGEPQSANMIMEAPATVKTGGCSMGKKKPGGGNHPAKPEETASVTSLRRTEGPAAFGQSMNSYYGDDFGLHI